MNYFVYDTAFFLADSFMVMHNYLMLFTIKNSENVIFFLTAVIFRAYFLMRDLFFQIKIVIHNVALYFIKVYFHT